MLLSETLVVIKDLIKIATFLYFQNNNDTREIYNAGYAHYQINPLTNKPAPAQ